MSLRGQPLKVNYAYRQFADEIEAQIMQGTLQPGERLPGEVELAEMFGVTRSTVREGLRQLESEGLVNRPSPRRLEVAVPQSDQLASRASRAMVLMNVTFRELWQVARETESLASALAAELATPEKVEILEDIHARFVAVENDVVETTRLDKLFHSQIAEMGENRVLSLAREPLALLLYQGFLQVAPKVPQAIDRQIEAHSHILGAIRNNDPESARDWTRRHIEDFWRGIQMAGLEDEPPISRET
ncbi:FadR family transcriptional regulator [Sedimentitalea sp. CY04]|uniref:FadR family transcriptional regulator n=1 Tax=Parasedimentitalea denitrificans TaxID=2211118 RepID=A0ABX0WBZ6_9RHOB|nr:GntR family transcriptional regulator [Sedimentitalea sp. CY04]NIZ62299.1 FadR family transcriptional regulator [Sedimentitalea sp. CY04]